MRRLSSLLVVGLLGLLLIVAACQAPYPFSTLTPTSKPTSRPATVSAGQPTFSPTASIDFSAVFRQLRDQLSQGSSLRPDMANDLQRALAAFLNTRADRRQSIDRQPILIDELRNALDLSPLGKPQVTVGDADGDQRLDMLVTIPAAGLPAFIIRHVPEGFIGYQVPKPAGIATDGPIVLQRVDDLNGDGVPELVLTTQIVGASALNTLISVARWDGQAFKTVLQTGISDWAGPTGWGFVKENGRETLVTTCPALGPYDHKLLPHPQLTRIFRWQAGDLVLDQVTLAPPGTIRQQINVAESAFRKGDLDRALMAYRRAAEDASLAQEPETQQIAWREYAWFRIGEIEALRGNEQAAREAMEQARAAGPALSDLAVAFLQGYENGRVAQGLTAIQHVDLYEQFYAGQGGNLGFPMDAAGILYPGLAVAAYLNAYPDAGQGSGEALTSLLRDLGLNVAGSAIVDLSGDGQEEVIVVLNSPVPRALEPEGWRQSLWLLTWQESGWWPQIIETTSSLVLIQTVPIAESGRRAVVYQRPENVSPRRAALSWDGIQILRYTVQAGGELAPTPSNPDPFQCTIP